MNEKELVALFATRVCDMFEQMQRGNWVDDYGHDVRLNTAMLALQEPVKLATEMFARSPEDKTE